MKTAAFLFLLPDPRIMHKVDYPIYECDRHFYAPPEAFLRHLPAVGGVPSDCIPSPTFKNLPEAVR